MGIKSNFNKFLKSKCPNSFEEVSLSFFKYKKVAIDISLFMHKFKAVCGDRWLTAFINLIACLRKNSVHCVFIFDGKSPIEKEPERKKRKDTREKMIKQLSELEQALQHYYTTNTILPILQSTYEKKESPKRLMGNKVDTSIDINWIEERIQEKKSQLYEISSEDFDLAKKMFTLLNVPFYTAPWEAEKLCAKLCIDQKVVGVLSEDTDVLAYGAPYLLTKIDTSNETCTIVDYSSILQELELSSSQFLDLCIMCGTDYNENIPKIGAITAYKHITQHGSVSKFSKQTKIDISILNYNRVKEMFTNFSDEIESLSKTIPFCAQPDFEKFVEFIYSNNISFGIERLKKSFVHTLVILEDDDDE